MVPHPGPSVEGPVRACVDVGRRAHEPGQAGYRHRPGRAGHGRRVLGDTGEMLFKDAVRQGRVHVLHGVDGRHTIQAFHHRGHRARGEP